MDIWHYLDKHNQTKQIAADELLPLANAGEITPQTNIWKEGMANWAPAGTVLPQLFADVPSSPPAIPTGTAMGSDAMKSTTNFLATTCRSWRSNSIQGRP